MQARQGPRWGHPQPFSGEGASWAIGLGPRIRDKVGFGWLAAATIAAKFARSVSARLRR
jgi:hypothetical protein